MASLAVHDGCECAPLSSRPRSKSMKMMRLTHRRGTNLSGVPTTLQLGAEVHCVVRRGQGQSDAVRPGPLTRLSFCCTPPLPLVGVSIVMERERQQSDAVLPVGRGAVGMLGRGLAVGGRALRAGDDAVRLVQPLTRVLSVCCTSSAFSWCVNSEREGASAE